MANKNRKRCSTSLIIREMQIKITMKQHFESIRMATIKRIGNEYSKGCRGIGILWTAGGNIIVQPLCKIIQRFLKKLKMELPYDLAILLLGEQLTDQSSILKRHVNTSIHCSIIRKIQYNSPKKCSFGAHLGMGISAVQEVQADPFNLFLQWNKTFNL